jgi:PAS domain S-box-containing protein
MEGRGQQSPAPERRDVGASRRGPDPVLVVALVFDTALAIVDAFTEQVVLFNLLIFGPLVAAFRTGPRRTAYVAIYALVLSILEGIPHHIFGKPDHIVRVAAIATTGALSVWGSWLRERNARAEQRAALRARAVALFARAGDVEQALAGTARLLVPTAADRCRIDLVEDGVLRCVADVEDDAVAEPAAGRAESPDDGDAATVARTGEPLVRDGTAVLPMRAQAGVVGTLTLERHGTRLKPDDPFIAFGSALAAECAIALDNARLNHELHASEEALRRSSDQLGTILGGVADGVLARDRTGTVVYANEAAVAILGLSSYRDLRASRFKAIGDWLHVYDEHGREVALGDLPGARLLRGEPAPDTLLRFESVASGLERWVLVKVRAVREDDGELRLSIVIFEDVTERHRREAGERFLAEGTKVLAGSLDYEQTLRTISALVVPQLADLCSIDVAAPGGAIRNVATTLTDTELNDRVQQLRRRHPPSARRGGVVAEVVRTGRPRLYASAEALDAATGEADAAELEVVRSLGLSSVIVVPMTARGRTLGAMTLATGGSGRTFDADDLVLAEELGRRCALAVDNARLYGERSHVARTLQRSLVPARLPHVPGFEVAARYHAVGEDAEVGGDFLDVFETEAGVWAAVIGDVSGKGADAAAVTALARYTVRAVAVHGRRASAVLRELNDAILRHELDERFCTAIFARLRGGDADGDGARVQLAVGGHPLPLLVRADGTVREVGVPGTALGIAPGPRLADREVELAPGDKLVLVTDGVVEAHVGGRMLGADGLRELLSGCGELDALATGERIELAVVGDGAEPRDDVAVLVVRAAGVRAAVTAREGLVRSGAMGRERELNLRLAGGAHAPAVARAALDSSLPPGALDAEHAHTARLLVSEIVTNSVRHGGAGEDGWIGLDVAISPAALRVEVTDHGPGFTPAPVRPPADDPGGRGLYLVEQMADRWGHAEAGTRVWFEVDREGRDAAD